MSMFKKVCWGLLGTASFIFLGLMVIFYSYVDPQVFTKKDFNENKDAQIQVAIVENKEELKVSTDQVVVLKSKNLDTLVEVFRLVNKPSPLNNLGAVIVNDIESNTFWSNQEIVNLTNQVRLENGISALNHNQSLSETARIRLEDMFAKGYFAHLSPSGEGVEKVVDGIGYAYITLGENLALGDFKDHQEIINAWLNSSTHRDNLLARRYADIGVAVKDGFFNGRKSVIAVQVFGTPLNKCFLPSQSDKNKILNNKNKLKSLETPLAQLDRVIENPGSTNLLARQRNILEYNRLAKEFNSLIDITKQMIIDYNKSVVLFNNCAKTVIN